MHAEIGDFQIRNLIEVARSMLKSRRDWYNRYGNQLITSDDKIPPCPSFRHYLHIKYIINDAMSHRRQHRRNVAEVWRIYAESVCKAL